MLKVLLLIVAQANVTSQSGYASLTPQVTAEGEHTFSLVANPPKKMLKDSGLPEEEWLMESIETLLAEKQWCLKGWEITDRQKVVGGIVTIQGRCREVTLLPSAGIVPESTRRDVWLPFCSSTSGGLEEPKKKTALGRSNCWRYV